MLVSMIHITNEQLTMKILMPKGKAVAKSHSFRPADQMNEQLYTAIDVYPQLTTIDR